MPPTLAAAPRPDLRRRARTTRQKVLLALAVLGALLVHVVLILLVAWIVPHWPRKRLHGQLAPIQLTMVPSTAPTPEPAGPLDAGDKKKELPFVRVPDDKASETPPEKADFQSSASAIAASELPANGDKPVPTTEGRDIPTFDFDTRPYRLGNVAADAATSAPSQPAEQVAPANTPQPTPPPPTDKKPLPAKSRPSRKPTAQPTPERGDLASLRAESTPTPEDLMPPPDTMVQDENVPPPPIQRQPDAQPQVRPSNPSQVASVGAPKPPGYQPQSIPSKMTGNINNRGRAIPAVQGTPLGRYEKAVSDAIGMRWYMYTEEKRDVVSSGTVKIHFYVSRSGKVREVRFTSGNSNGVLADVSMEAIEEAELMPIPEDVAAALPDGELEVEYTFGYY